MNVIVKLFLSALFSIHQYLPDDDARFKKYYNDVREANQEDIFPAAHETCRYLISVFVDAGLEVTLGSSNNSFLSQSLAGIIGGDKTLDSLLKIVNSGEYADKFLEHNIDPKEVTESIKAICSTNFSSLNFRPEQRKEVFDFIQSEINVLDKVHLNSLGDYNYFGSVNIFDHTGETIGTLDAVPRAWVPYEQMSKSLTLSLLATEDDSFFDHKGVDSKAIARIVKQMLAGDRTTGGSTVTMQLLKNLYFLNGPASKYEELNTSNTFSTLLRKVREWYWAWPYEKEHAKVLGDVSAKKYILEMYFNLVDFGPRIQGIEQASYVYFSKSATQLDLAESAFITTLLKAPTKYSDQDNYVEYSEPRRNDYILSRVEDICSEVFKTQDSGFGSLDKANLYKRLCTDGKNKIDHEYIVKEKAKSLPVWIRPTNAPVSESMLLVRNQIEAWIKNNKFDPELMPKEVSLQTTINQKLQNIVFNVVRKRLDEYDEQRNILDNVTPANDDTGRLASFKADDIDYRLVNQLEGLANQLSNKLNKYFFTVDYKGYKSNTNQSLDYNKVSEYLNSIESDKAKISKIIENIAKDLKAKTSSLGELRFIKFNNLDYEILSTSDLLNLETVSLEVKLNLEKFSRKYIVDHIMVNALRRMDRVKPRSFMSVGVINEAGILVDNKLNPINLADSHKNFISRKKYKLGNFFWLRSSENSKSENQSGEVFYLSGPKLQAAVFIMDTHTGEVLANFGGYDPLFSSFNRSKDAYRQAGSTLKPWIYFFGLNKGFNPQDIVNNSYVSFNIPGKRKAYVPKNYSSSLNGHIAYFESMVNSQNIGTYSLIQNPIWGPDWQTNLLELKNFFEQIELYKEVKEDVTIMLGAQEITIENLVGSFSFFATGSKIARPQYIKYVTDYKGHNLFEMDSSYVEVPVYKNESIFQIQTMLAEVANSGTAGRVNKFVRELSDGKYKDICYNNVIGENKQTCFGGKTGTSNDAKDVWFIGFSKNFVIGTWVGYDDPRSVGYKATGGGIALPIFQDIVSEGEAYLPQIEPYITPDMIPSGLERRVVYGLQACSGGTGSQTVIYVDQGSKQNRCGGSSSSYAGGSQSNEAQASDSGSNNNSTSLCQCVLNQYGGYSLNILYQGKSYPNFQQYNSSQECEMQKYQIRSKAGKLVCQ